jgi:hypothetical protein
MTDSLTDSLISSSGSRIVSIAPSNATEFSQGQKIIFDLDASLGYIKGRDTYLVLDVLNDSSDASMWSFPQGVGAHALINRIDIYSRSTGQHLETLENYNQWACIETQFTHDDFTNIQQLEGVGSPCHQYINGYDATGTEFRESIQLDPRNVENCMLSPLNADNKTPLYATRRFLIQPKCGVFRHWDTEQITPCVNMGGLRIEIIMEQIDLVCKRLGAVAQQPADDDRPRQIDLLNDGIAIVSNVDGGASTISTDVTEVDGYFTDLASLGLCIGNRVVMVGTLTGPPVQNIEFATTIADLAVAGTAGQINITINPAFPAGQDLQDIKLKVVETSTSYKVKAAELRVAVMMVPPAVIPSLKGALMYEFTSYDHFIDTIAATERRHQVPINSVASKARAVFSHFTDVDTENNMSLMSYYSGMAPSDMDLNSVQFFINNRLYPLRAYNPDAGQDKPIAVNELVKAMKVCGLAPINLGSNEAGNLNDYTNSFVIARELARGEYVADLRNAEPEIRLGFSATRTGNSRVNTYVFSRKVVNIGVSGVAVEL